MLLAANAAFEAVKNGDVDFDTGKGMNVKIPVQDTPKTNSCSDSDQLKDKANG
jgi:hypothetical protein